MFAIITGNGKREKVSQQSAGNGHPRSPRRERQSRLELAPLTGAVMQKRRCATVRTHAADRRARESSDPEPYDRLEHNPETLGL